MLCKTDNPSRWESALYPLLIVLFFILNTYPVFDGDFFWHLHTGEWIWNHKSLPNLDPFTFTADPASAEAGSHRIPMLLTQYWLGQLAFFGLWQLGGFKGIILLRAFIYSIILIFIGVWSRKIAKGILPFFFLFIVGAQLLRHANERPQLFAFLLMPVALYLLETLRTGATRRKTDAWLLPLLMLLWANVHASFILGVGIILLFTAGHLLHGWRDATPIRKEYLSPLLGAVGASLVNPNGFWPFIEFFRTDSYLLSITQEYQSPFVSLLQFHTFDPYWLLLVPALMLLLLRGRKIPLEHCFLLAALAALSLSGGRYIPFFIFTLPIILLHLPAIALPQRYEALCALLIFVLFLQFNFKGSFKFRESSDFPKQAVAFINNVLPAGRIFNRSEWGGYVSLFAPGHQVFIDGRILVEELQKKQLAAMNGSDWKDLFAQYDISIAILPMRSLNPNTFQYGPPPPLVAALLRERYWLPIYRDQLAIVFVQDRPVHAEITKKYRLDSDQLLRQLNGEKR